MNKLVQEYGKDAMFDFETIYNEYLEYAEKIRSYVSDTSVIVYDAIKAGKKVLFEGAQGTLLDLDLGTYPFVTSSHPISGGFAIGAGVGPNMIKDVVGIVKAYTTRVGEGPFVTELDNEIGEEIRVLVVDDEKLIVKGIRFSLEQDGMEESNHFGGMPSRRR